MGKGTVHPSTEELEAAIAALLEKGEAVTAKEIRQRLQTDHQGWKVPGERRIAKKLKRLTPKHRKHGFFHTLKVGRSPRSLSANPEPVDTALPETHPGSEELSFSSNSPSEMVRRGSFKKWFLGKGKMFKSKSTQEKVKVEESEGSVCGFSSEFAGSEENQSVGSCDGPHDGEMKNAAKATEPVVQPEGLELQEEEEEEDIIVGGLEEEEKIVIVASSKNSEEDKVVVMEAPAKDRQDEFVQRKLTTVEEAYSDENDGKKEKCECAGCIIL